MADIHLDSNAFAERSARLRSCVPHPLVIALGKAAESQEFTANSALFHYLLGYEFPETILVLTQPPLAITSPKKAAILRQIPALNIIIRNKDDSNRDEVLNRLPETFSLVDAENMHGSLCEAVRARGTATDATSAVIAVLAHKEDKEVALLRRAATVASHLLGKAIGLLRDMEFSEEALEQFMSDKLPGIDSDYIEFSRDPSHAYDPEGGNCFVRLGVRYRGYCAEVARPFMTDASALYAVQARFQSLLRAGVRTATLLAQLRAAEPAHEIACYTIGLLAQERPFEEDFVLEAGMCCVICVDGVFANTFLVDTLPAQLTKRDRFEDYTPAGMRMRNKNRDANLLQEIKEHQRVLLDRLLEDSLAAARAAPAEALRTADGPAIERYACDADVPRSPRVTLDWERMYVIVPLGSHAIPFHITAIKNVSATGALGASRLRINLKVSREIAATAQHTAGIAANDNANADTSDSQNRANTTATAKSTGYDTTIKAICVDVPNAEELCAQINDMRREYARPQHTAPAATALRERPRCPVLADVYARTDHRSSNRKALGNLELHENGLRYGDTAILFSNIKHAFLFEGSADTRALLHFVLHEPIPHGRPTQHIQFFRQYTFAAHDTNRREDDRMELIRLEEEAAETARTNAELTEFARQLEAAAAVHVQRPEPAFLAVHAREAVDIGATGTCLVAVAEQPFFVLAFHEVEIASLERMTYTTRTFDCVFVFKDKRRPVVSLGSIDSPYLAEVKMLLDSHNIVFMETGVSIHWPNVLQSIRDDPVSFYEGGGWAELLRGDEEASSEESDKTVSESEETSSEEDDESTGATTESEESVPTEESESDDEDDDDEDDEDDEDSSGEVEITKKSRMY